MKYGVVAMLFLFNNEIVSLIALSVMTLFFIADICVERSKL